MSNPDGGGGGEGGGEKRMTRLEKKKTKMLQEARLKRAATWSEIGDFVLAGDVKGMAGAVRGTMYRTNQRYQETKSFLSQKTKNLEALAKEGSPDHPYPRVAVLVVSTRFEVASTFLIFANAAFIGWQAELREGNIVVTILEHLFTFCFVTELTLRTLTYGWPTLLAKENWLDVFLVALGVLTTWMLGPFGVEVTFLRKLTALRILRLMRAAKAVRLRPEFKEMWALIRGLSESGETLFWTYVMMGCVLYFFAIIATSLIGKQDAFKDNPLAQEYFGDVLLSMFTLFQLMTVDSWTGFARPLMEVQAWVGIFFIVFIAVAVFVMLNLVTAVIVENAFDEAKQDEKEKAVQLEREKEEELEDLRQFFKTIDLDGSGSLTKAELFGAAKQRKVRQKLRALGIMPKDIAELWEILDDGNGELDSDEFVNGIRRLRGEAKSKDILRLYKELRQFENAVSTVESDISSSRRRMENIKLQLERCRTDVAAFQRTMQRAKEAVKMAAQTQQMY